MTRSSCISHTTSQQVVIIREDYLSICDGNHCAAALLNVFEYWMNYKLNHREQAQTENKIAAAGGAPLIKDDLWVYKTAENLKDELLGLFADTKITAALVLLKAKGFISTRNNPSYGWDRTLQYLFNTEIVQQAVNISDAYTILKNKVSKPYKKRIKAVEKTDGNLKNKEAIPETTTETTTESNASVPDGTETRTIPNVPVTAVVKAAEAHINQTTPPIETEFDLSRTRDVVANKGFKFNKPKQLLAKSNQADVKRIDKIVDIIEDSLPDISDSDRSKVALSFYKYWGSKIIRGEPARMPLNADSFGGTWRDWLAKTYKPATVNKSTDPALNLSIPVPVVPMLMQQRTEELEPTV